ELLDAYAMHDKDRQRPAHFRRNVETMIEALDKRFGKVNPGDKGLAVLYHSMLSDICHPAIGGTMPYFDVGSPPGMLHYPGGVTETAFEFLLTEVLLPVVDLAARHGVDALNRLTYVGKTLTSSAGAASAE